jgi:hypothetical protein
MNNRKHYVGSAALAALLVLVAGGANALANTVWTVSKTSSVASCEPAIPGPLVTTCNTIQSAVTAASGYDVIVVGPGKYTEEVTISGLDGLVLYGAQAGNDARVGRWDTSKESIVDATGSADGTAFNVQSNYVVIDGFTIQNAKGASYGAGIWINCNDCSSYVGYEDDQILNNIIQNNAIGAYLTFSCNALVQHNLFKTNNNGQGGSSLWTLKGLGGIGIGGTPDDGSTITENAFTGNKAAAMDLVAQESGQITNNTSEKDGAFLVCDFCGPLLVSQNQGRDFGAAGQLPAILPGKIAADAAIDIGDGTSPLQISENDLEDGKTPNGIAFNPAINFDGNASSAGACQYCLVTNNTIKGFPGNGIVAEMVSGLGTLWESTISRNLLERNGNDGILIQGPVSDTNFNYDNQLLSNEARDNQGIDCVDDTIGSVSTLIGTLGTANTWYNNSGSTSSPAGLCTPSPWH